MNRAFDRAKRHRDERRAARPIVLDQPTGPSAPRPACCQRGKTSSRVGSIRKRTPIRGKTSALRTPRVSGGRPVFPVGGNGSVARPTIAQRLCISRRASCHAVFAPGGIRSTSEARMCAARHRLPHRGEMNCRASIREVYEWPHALIHPYPSQRNFAGSQFLASTTALEWRS